MTDTQELESTLTDRYQTTVPGPVRRALKLGKRDKIRYVVREGEVVMTRVPDDGNDPIVGRYLEFLAHDMERHPERIQAVDAALAKRVRALAKGVKLSLDQPLDPDDE